MAVSNAGNKMPLKLEIEEHIEDVIVDEHGEAVFEFKVNANSSQPICSWYRNGQLITSSHRIEITFNGKWYRLVIRSVRRTDHGTYTIVCQNDTEQISSKANLYVCHVSLSDSVIVYTQLPVKGSGIIRHMCNLKLEKGKTIELEVEFEIVAINQNYHWYKNNEIIEQDSRTIIISSKGLTTLSILFAEITDTGIYSAIANTTEGILSSFADVQVTAVSEVDRDAEALPDIEYLLPEEKEVNENEDMRLICNAFINNNTTVKWKKSGKIIKNVNNFIPQDYGHNYVGLKGFNVSQTDAGDYTIVLRDEKTKREAFATCRLIVNQCPDEDPPVTYLSHPLESVVACCGTKVTFNCSFTIIEGANYYVVWRVGHYKIERSGSQFKVMGKGGSFLLLIEKLEPEMSGEVVCELRRALPFLYSVYINSSHARLSIVPASVLHEEKNANPLAKGGNLFYEGPSEHDCIAEDSYAGTNVAETSDESSEINYEEAIMYITYCRLDEDGLFFLHSSRGSSVVDFSNLVLMRSDATNCIRIQWTGSPALRCWYAVYWQQSDGHFKHVGDSSSPCFEILNPPLQSLVRICIEPAPIGTAGAREVTTIVPAPEAVPRSLQNYKLQPMEQLLLNYSTTGYTIGSGAFGSVEIYQALSGDYRAAKIIKTPTEKKQDAALREYEIMKKLQHPKLIELLDAYASNDSFVIVIDYLWGGELFDRIVDETHIKEIDVIQYVKQICEAIEYLHHIKVAHLDLKPENIMCLSPNSRDIKIIDFGMARILDEGIIIRGMYGTRDYVAPEVLNLDRLTPACDMWSLGVITYVLLSGAMPFYGDTPVRTSSITLGKYNYDDIAFKEISDLAKDFVDSLLVVHPEYRLTATAALNHKWIKEGPPKISKAGHMRRTRENMRSYLANYRSRWQRAGNVMIAAHRLRTLAETSQAASSERLESCVIG